MLGVLNKESVNADNLNSPHFVEIEKASRFEGFGCQELKYGLSLNFFKADWYSRAMA